MNKLLLSLVVALTACSGSDVTGNPSSALPLIHRVRHATTISHVYVLTLDTGGGGKNQILRFPALTNTSTPDKTVNTENLPIFMRVSPFDGRIAVVYQMTNEKVVVYDKDLNVLYTLNLQRTADEYPYTVAFGPLGNLYVAVDSSAGSVYTGKVEEFSGSDTTPDAIYTLPDQQAVTSMAFSPSGEPYYQTIEQDNGGTVFTCTQGPSYECFNTHIPSYSQCIDSSSCPPPFPAQIALTDGTDLGEMCVCGYSTLPTRFIERYIAPTSGTHGRWIYSSHDKHCDAVNREYMQDYNVDANATQYYSCIGPYGSPYGPLPNSSVNEYDSLGSQYSITGLTNPYAAGGY